MNVVLLDLRNIMVMLITGLVLGLVWNHFHPMKLPLTLEEVKVPGIPAHI